MKNPSAQELGRLGGLARAKKLTKERRIEIAKQAALTKQKRAQINKQLSA